MLNIDLSSCESMNDISFNPAVTLHQENDDTSEGESHAKSKNKKRSSSQMTIKKPLGMSHTRRYVCELSLIFQFCVVLGTLTSHLSGQIGNQ